MNVRQVVEPRPVTDLRHSRPATGTASSTLPSSSLLRLSLLVIVFIIRAESLTGARRVERDDSDVPASLAVSSVLVASYQSSESALISFIANFTSATAARKRHTDDTCRIFKTINWTVGDVGNQSLSIVHLDYTVEIMHRACVLEQGDARKAMECLQQEMSGILWRSCQQRLSFNAKQRTHPYCYFVQEAADCKVALVSSACGTDAGELAYHMIALTTSRSQENTCSILPVAGDYRGFQYDANCPSYFVDDLELCAIKHIYSQNNLLFRADNDLVTMTADAASITDACRTYREYKLCVRPINKACRRGVRLVYAHQPALRLYRLKMDFICSKTNRRQYIREVSCFHAVLESGADSDASVRPSLHQCDRYWQLRVRPSLRHVSPHRFYCDVSANDTLSVRRRLGRLTSCYKRVFKRHCGVTGGRLVAGLMGQAFADPHYQRYRYRPDCRLHRQQPTSLTTTSTSSSDDHTRCTSTTGRHSAAAAIFVVMTLLSLTL